MLTFTTINQRDVAKLGHHSSPLHSSSPAPVFEPGVLPYIIDKQILCMVVTEFTLVVSHEPDRTVMRIKE